MFQFPDFKNPNLLACALTHSSCAGEPGFDLNLESYERLEFLGDAVLSLVFAEILYHAKIGDQGKMTKIKSYVVSNRNLAKICSEIGLDQEARFGKSYTSGKSASSISKAKADIFESYLGALYLDQGYDAARDFIVRVVPLNYSRQEMANPKSDLQELLIVHKGVPEYYLVGSEGPDHSKVFTSVVTWGQSLYSASGQGDTIKNSQMNAAKKAIEIYWKDFYQKNYGDANDSGQNI